MWQWAVTLSQSESGKRLLIAYASRIFKQIRGIARDGLEHLSFICEGLAIASVIEK